MKTTFPEIESTTGLLPRLPGGAPILGEGLWMRLFGPESRGWFWACRFWVQGGVSPTSEKDSRELLEALSQKDRTMASLFLDCALALIECEDVHKVPDKVVLQLAGGDNHPPGFVRDVLSELGAPDERMAPDSGMQGRAVRPFQCYRTVPVLLIDDRGSRPEGVVADLRLELVPGGTGRVYPAPALAFLRRDAAFEDAAGIALQRAIAAGVWPADSDLRWTLSRRDRHPLATLLIGNSLGGSFALGLEMLLVGVDTSRNPFGKLALAGVAVSAAFGADGSLGPVGDILHKLIVAARDLAFPRLHTVIIAAREELEIPGLEKQPEDPAVLADPLEDFHVLKAPTLSEAIQMLRRDQQGRWQGIDCQLPPPDPDFTGREALFKRVRDFIKTRSSGYLVLRGEMGIGKSAFMAALLHAERAAGNLPVYHIISSVHTGNPEQIAACLYDRLRRKHRILEPFEWARFRVEEKLERLMVKLSEKLLAEDRKEVLYLDAADQAQLVSGKCLIPDFLGRFPPNFICIVTSRFRDNWHRFHGQIEFCDISEVIDAQVDVRDYLRKKASQIQPPLEEEAIERIASHSPTFFTVISCFRRLQDPSTPEETRRQLRSDSVLWTVPPEDLIEEELQHRLLRAAEDKIPEEEFWLALLLLTVTGDDHLGSDQLGQLGVWTDERKAVLESCASFFKSRPSLETPDRPYVFAHPGYIREIQKRGGAGRIRKAHELLAQGSVNALNHREELACGYALRHLAVHLRHAHNYDQLCAFLTNFDFLLMALGIGSGAEKLASAPEVSVFRLVYEFRRAYEAVPEKHPKRDELKELGGLIDKHSHLLQEDPSLLPQLLYNDLVWRLEGQSSLFQRVHALAEKQSRPWLKSVKPPACKESAEPTRMLSGHQRSVLAVAFSPDDTVLVSGSADKTIRVWRGLSGESVSLGGHSGTVNTISFAPDGLHFAGGSNDGSISLWEARTRRLVRRLDTGSGPVLALVFTPDGTKLISAGADGLLYFWDPRALRLLHKSGGHGAAIRALAASPDSRLVVSGGEDKTIRVWDASDGIWRATIREQDRWVEAVAFLHDSLTIVSGGGFRCGDVKFWNLEGHCIRTWPDGHDEGIKALAVSPDGLKLASGSYDGKVLVRNIRTGGSYLPMGHTDRVEALAFSKDSRTLATASADRRVRIWDVSGEPSAPAVHANRTLENMEPSLQGLAFLREGQLAVACGKTSILKVIDTASGTVCSVMYGQRGRDFSCVAASSDDRLIAGGTYQQVQLWGIDSGTTGRTLYGHNGWVLACAFSPDSKLMASGGEDDNLILWDVVSGAWLRSIHCQQARVRAIGFSADGQHIATGGEDGTLKIWDSVTSSAPARVFEPHRSPVVAVAFAPHGRFVVTGSEDESLRLLDYEAGILFSPMRLHRGAVTALAFSRDDRVLASGSTDSTVGVWDIQANRALAWMPCSDRVLAIRFGSKSNLIQAADAGGASHRPGFYHMELANIPGEAL
jgi:WD40 repeat protein